MHVTRRFVSRTTIIQRFESEKFGLVLLRLVKYCHTVFTYPVQNSSASSGSARMIVIVDDEQICQKAVRIDSESRSEARACFNSRTSMPPPLPKESVAAAKGFRVQLPRSQSHSMLHVACSVPCRMWQSHVAVACCVCVVYFFANSISLQYIAPTSTSRYRSMIESPSMGMIVAFYDVSCCVQISNTTSSFTRRVVYLHARFER